MIHAELQRSCPVCGNSIPHLQSRCLDCSREALARARAAVVQLRQACRRGGGSGRGSLPLDERKVRFETALQVWSEAQAAWHECRGVVPPAPVELLTGRGRDTLLQLLAYYAPADRQKSGPP